MVSVVIPVFNGELYIEETINSVLNQSHQNFEIIVVNDGSTDSTEKIVKGIKDERIQYFRKENSGVSNTRNFGIEKARGEYIAFLDADDIFLPENLQKKINFLETNQEYDFVFSNMNNADENMQIIGIAPSGKDENILHDILIWNGEVIPGPCSNLVIRKKCLENGLRFDPKLSTAADQDFTLYLAKNHKGKLIKEPLWNYRILGNSMSRNIKVMEEDHIKVFKKAAQNKLFKTYWFKQKCFSNLYLILAGSWWIDGKNKKKGAYFLTKSVLAYPPNISKVLMKLI